MFSEVPTARPKDRDLAEIPMAASGTQGSMGKISKMFLVSVKLRNLMAIQVCY